MIKAITKTKNVSFEIIRMFGKMKDTKKIKTSPSITKKKSWLKNKERQKLKKVFKNKMALGF